MPTSGGFGVSVPVVVVSVVEPVVSDAEADVELERSLPERAEPPPQAVTSTATTSNATASHAAVGRPLSRHLRRRLVKNEASCRHLSKSIRHARPMLWVRTPVWVKAT
jgi:hypothetical protein